MPLAPRRAPTSPHPTINYPLSTHERPDVPSEMHITNEMKALFNLHSNPLCREQQQSLDLPHHLQPLPLLPVPLPRAVEGPRHRLAALPAVHAALLRAGRPGGARGPGAPQVLHAAPEGQVREKHSHQKGAQSSFFIVREQKSRIWPHCTLNTLYSQSQIAECVRNFRYRRNIYVFF